MSVESLCKCMLIEDYVQTRYSGLCHLRSCVHPLPDFCPVGKCNCAKGHSCMVDGLHIEQAPWRMHADKRVYTYHVPYTNTWFTSDSDNGKEA